MRGFRRFGEPLATIGDSGQARQSYAQYQASKNHLLWLRFNELSGNPLNSGSLALTITQTVCTQGVTGAKQPNEAYTFDGAAASGSIVSIANNNTLKALTTQRWAFLCNPTSLNNSGILGVWGALGATDHLVLRLFSSNRIGATIGTDGTNANAVTNNNQISDCIGAWCWLFMDYDEITTRKIRLWKALMGANTATLLTLATDTAGTGTVDQPSTALQFGNILARNATLDGKLDEVFCDAALWTDTEMSQLLNYFK